MSNISRKFEGIWISKDIWLSKQLTLLEKVFYVEIKSLDNKDGCFASNDYFSKFFDISKSRVSQVISSLKEKGFVKVDLIYKGKQVEKRVVRILSRGSEFSKEGSEFSKEGYLENDKDSNTYINNTINNTIKKKETIPKKTEKVFSASLHNCLDNCLNFFPEHLHPNDKTTWLETLEKLNRIDKVPFLEIERIVKHTRNDNFWKQNFLSIPKLRKKNRDGIMYIVVFNEAIPKQQDKMELIRKNIDIF